MLPKQLRVIGFVVKNIAFESFDNCETILPDSSSVTTQTEKPKIDSVILSVEDSVWFFKACEEEKKLINQFCECVQKMEEPIKNAELSQKKKSSMKK